LGNWAFEATNEYTSWSVYIHRYVFPLFIRESHCSFEILAGSGLVSTVMISLASCIVRRASNVQDQYVQLAPLSFGRAIPDGSAKVDREEDVILEMARGPALAAAAAGVAGTADICYEMICRRGASATGLNKDGTQKGSLL
jgi:hypothetical protein